MLFELYKLALATQTRQTKRLMSFYIGLVKLLFLLVDLIQSNCDNHQLLKVFLLLGAQTDTCNSIPPTSPRGKLRGG